MNMHFYRKLPIPMEIKQQLPATEKMLKTVERTIAEENAILSGRCDKFMLIIGPCSADREDAVIDYLYRLKGVQEKVADKILIIPRVYTSKPRTTGSGYKGLLHQPDPNEEPDILKGIVAIRRLHLRAIAETELASADEMLYPENHRYLSDLLVYASVGARSVENQQHRLTASGLDIPVGMKNPTSGDLSVMLNAINAAHSSHVFCYRGWEVKTEGNPYSHAILRGFVDKNGISHANYTADTVTKLAELYSASELSNPACIIDTNHDNSAKCHLEQPRIAKEVIGLRKADETARKLIKGLMIESYIEDGRQDIAEEIYGKSITDPCLGWEKTERLIYEIADAL